MEMSRAGRVRKKPSHFDDFETTDEISTENQIRAKNPKISVSFSITTPFHHLRDTILGQNQDFLEKNLFWNVSFSILEPLRHHRVKIRINIGLWQVSGTLKGPKDNNL